MWRSSLSEVIRYLVNCWLQNKCCRDLCGNLPRSTNAIGIGFCFWNITRSAFCMPQHFIFLRGQRIVLPHNLINKETTSTITISLGKLSLSINRHSIMELPWYLPMTTTGYDALMLTNCVVLGSSSPILLETARRRVSHPSVSNMHVTSCLRLYQIRTRLISVVNNAMSTTSHRGSRLIFWKFKKK